MQLNRKGILKNNQAKALEKLDKMVEEINDTSLPGMCPLNFLQPIPHSYTYASPSPTDDMMDSPSPPPPQNSKSDNNLYMRSKHNSHKNNVAPVIGHSHNHHFHHHHNHHRIKNSQSFTHQNDIQCEQCARYAHQSSRHHRIHSHACQII